MGKESITLSMELAKTQSLEFECFEDNYSLTISTQGCRINTRKFNTKGTASTSVQIFWYGEFPIANLGAFTINSNPHSATSWQQPKSLRSPCVKWQLTHENILSWGEKQRNKYTKDTLHGPTFPEVSPKISVRKMIWDLNFSEHLL